MIQSIRAVLPLLGILLLAPQMAARPAWAQPAPDVAERAARERAECLQALESRANGVRTEVGDAKSPEARNRLTVIGFMESISTGAVDAALAYFADDLVWWIPGDPEFVPFAGNRDKNEVDRMLRAASAGLGFCIVPDSFTAEADRVSVEARSFGLSRVGNIYNQKYHFLFTVSDGRIHQVKAYGDTLHASQVLQEVQADAKRSEPPPDSP